MNQLKITQVQHLALLALFPEAWQEKLKLYTGEELYYAYRLCMFDPKRDKITGDFRGGDITFLSIKAKLKAWLKGEHRPGAYGIMREAMPIAPQAWAKLGRKWALDFSEEYVFTQPIADKEALDKLASTFNSKRVA